MPQVIPSRQALRHLTRLCRALNTTDHAVSPKTTTRQLCLTSKKLPPQLCLQTPLHIQHHHHRTITTTRSLRIQPSTSNPETDPQNQNTTALPDITNYYTLFPSTIPHGPPTGPELAQSSSSTPTEPPTPQSQFDIDLPTLRKEFLQLQSLHHPDKYPAGTPSHKQSLALSSLINTAYKTLSDPLLRAQYLLTLQYDIDVMSEDNSAHPTDQSTLMEVMEAQERIEEAKEQEEIEEIKSENRTRIRETEKKVGEAFEKGDGEAAKNETVRLKYWRSLQDGLNDWEPGKEVRLIH